MSASGIIMDSQRRQKHNRNALLHKKEMIRDSYLSLIRKTSTVQEFDKESVKTLSEYERQQVRKSFREEIRNERRQIVMKTIVTIMVLGLIIYLLIKGGYIVL